MLRRMARGASAGSGDDAFAGPRNALAGLAVLALAVVIGLELRPVGAGPSEQPDHLLLMLSQERPQVERILLDAGFDVDVEMLPSDPQAAVDLEDLIEVADERGFGFLVVDDVSNIDPEGLDFEGDPWPGHGSWVAISAGDLAFPHHVTAASAAGLGPRGASLAVLEMVFAQPRLDRGRESLVRRPALDEVLLNARLEAGMNMLDRASAQRRLSVEMELRLAERLTGDLRMTPILDPLAIGGALPLGPRTLLTTARAVEFVIEPDSSLEDVLEDMVSMRRVTLDHEGRVTAHEDCSATFGGRLSAAEFQSLRASRDSEFLALQRRDGQVQFYRASPSATCGYALAGSHRVSPGVDAGVVGVRGVLAGTELAGEGARVAFRAADGTTRVSPIVRATLRSPVWIDDAHVVVPGSDDELEPGVGAALYVFSVFDDTLVEKIELPEALARRGVSSVVVSDARAREVILSSGRHPTRLYLARLGREVTAPGGPAAASPESAASSSPRSPAGRDATERSPLDRRAHPVEALSLVWSSEDSYDLHVSQDGELLVFATAGDELREDHGVRSRRYQTLRIDLLAARRGELRVEALAESALNDRKPVLVPGGEFAVVSSRARLGVRRREVVTPRVVRLLDEFK